MTTNLFQFLGMRFLCSAINFTDGKNSRIQLPRFVLVKVSFDLDLDEEKPCKLIFSSFLFLVYNHIGTSINLLTLLIANIPCFIHDKILFINLSRSLSTSDLIKH